MRGLQKYLLFFDSCLPVNIDCQVEFFRNRGMWNLDEPSSDVVYEDSEVDNQLWTEQLEGLACGPWSDT